MGARHGWPVVRHTPGDPGTLLVVTRSGLRVRWQDRSWGWHPGMGHALATSGAEHPWVRLSGVERGHTVLDTTLGFGTDAAFLAAYTGTTVVGVERSPLVALLAEEGLAGAGADVRVERGEARAVLAHLPDASVDLVIADPMFPAETTSRTTSLDLLHWAGHPDPLDAGWLAQAQRVARRAVVVKDAAGHDLLERLGAPVIRARRGRLTRWGAWLRGPTGW